MILVRTPYRISLFGGGTDLPDWYFDNGGLVISSTINKYCYIAIHPTPVTAEYQHRISYSKTEIVENASQVEHPVVRELFRPFDKKECGLQLHHVSDLPARSGLGSSSAFAVCLLHAIKIYNGLVVDKMDLASEAITLEREVLKENVGDQDQVICSYGGFNKIIFENSGWQIESLPLSAIRKQEILDHLILINTGVHRTSSDINKHLVENIISGRRNLKNIQKLAEESLNLLVSNAPMIELGSLMKESWKQKVLSNPKSTTPLAESMFDCAINSGALGGKLLGAGGGGFMLLVASPEKHQVIISKMKETFRDVVHVPFRFEEEGSKCLISERY